MPERNNPSSKLFPRDSPQYAYAHTFVSLILQPKRRKTQFVSSLDSALAHYPDQACAARFTHQVEQLYFHGF